MLNDDRYPPVPMLRKGAAFVELGLAREIFYRLGYAGCRDERGRLRLYVEQSEPGVFCPRSAVRAPLAFRFDVLSLRGCADVSAHPLIGGPRPCGRPWEDGLRYVDLLRAVAFKLCPGTLPLWAYFRLVENTAGNRETLYEVIDSAWGSHFAGDALLQGLAARIGLRAPEAPSHAVK